MTLDTNGKVEIRLGRGSKRKTEEVEEEEEERKAKERAIEDQLQPRNCSQMTVEHKLPDIMNRSPLSDLGPSDF